MKKVIKHKNRASKSPAFDVKYVYATKQNLTRRLYRFFLVSSNYLKIVGTAGVTVTMLPVVLYAPLYLYKILFAPENKKWDDFYGFNTGGKWKISYVMMHLGTALICILLYFALNG